MQLNIYCVMYYVHYAQYHTVYIGDCTFKLDIQHMCVYYACTFSWMSIYFSTCLLVKEFEGRS